MKALLTVALAQDAPVWLDRAATLDRVLARVDEAAAAGARLVVFGEAFVPGYPFWVEHTEGARFESALQKAWYAHYLDQAVDIERGDLDALRARARCGRIWVMLGIIERPRERGGGSAYCALVTIDDGGEIRNVHRKLVPTFEERLVWSPGDGHGLRTFDLDGFTLGGLNCWENWMPLARSALYAQGMNLHVAVWPGNVRNTLECTRFIAREGRSLMLSVSAVMRREDIGEQLPHADLLRAHLPEICADGGSCIAGPDGQWILPPQAHSRGLLLAELDPAAIRRERQNFDPFGHYSRPDVLHLSIHRQRQTGWSVED
jgi:nitrilase